MPSKPEAPSVDRQPGVVATRRALLLAGLQVLLALPYLQTVPRFYGDEAWEASVGYSVAFEGQLRNPINESWGGMHIHFVQPQFVLPFVTAAIFKIFGLGVISARMGSVVMSAIGIALLHDVMRRWFSERTALWICLATMIHPWFFEITRRVRPEAYYFALAMAGLWCLARWAQSPTKRYAIGGGALAALATLSHPTGGVLTAAFIVGVLIWLRPPKLARLVGWSLLGLIVAALPYAIHTFWAIQDPRVDFIQQVTGRKDMITTQVGSILGSELYRWSHYFQWPKGAALCVLNLLAWAAALYRSSRADRAVATMILVFALLLPFTTVNTTSRYLAALSPLFCVLVVRLVARLFSYVAPAESLRLACARVVGVVTAGALAVTCFTALGLMFYRLHGADVNKVLDQVAAIVQRDGIVYGDMMLWMERERFHRVPYPVGTTLQERLEVFPRNEIYYAVRSAWAFKTSHGVTVPPRQMPPFRPDLTDRVCAAFGTKVGEFRDPYFGPFEVYLLSSQRVSRD
ncbi:MAG: glycosyltransferase family 39 protein [Phycisphaerales bacterium]|nr:MAG: glycosyltransferase family 39 protein [Phycisphaerales bacterium]